MKRLLAYLLAAVALLACNRDEIETVGEDRLMNIGVLVGGKEYQPIDASGTELTVFVPDGTDLKQLAARFSGKAVSVTVNGVEQESGVTVNNFSSANKGVVFHAVGPDGKSEDYTVRVLDTRLPVVSVTTATPEEIDSKVDWRNASIRVRETDGSVKELGGTNIRGRGNWTWEYYPKKPYALKLYRKQGLLGMPAHDRWVLLALYRGFIGNALMFEATRRAPSMEWAPRGRYVEFVLNGKYQGLYYLCEHIKIDKNRVNITPVQEKDVTYPNVSGGYLLEYDQLYDDEHKFKSKVFRMPVMLKSTNDSVPEAQMKYISDFINEMEAEIQKIGTGQESRYRDYLDIDSFADYWLVLETIGNYEAWKPRSVKMYKGRDGVDSPRGTVCKLKAGPLWDQELFLVDHVFNSKDMYYFKYLFRDPEFVATVKKRWEVYKSNILGNDRYIGFVDYLNEINDLISRSAKRDIAYWHNSYFTLSGEVAPVRYGFNSKIEWMDEQIKAL